MTKTKPVRPAQTFVIRASDFIRHSAFGIIQLYPKPDNSG